MTTDKKVAFFTLGCKLNFSETSTIARDFQNEGFERVDFEEFADIYVQTISYGLLSGGFRVCLWLWLCGV